MSKAVRKTLLVAAMLWVVGSIISAAPWISRDFTKGFGDAQRDSEPALRR